MPSPDKNIRLSVLDQSPVREGGTPQDAIAEPNRQRMIHGTPETVKARILALADQYDVEEFVVLSNCYDFDARVRSYELLSEAFGLANRETPE